MRRDLEFWNAVDVRCESRPRCARPACAFVVLGLAAGVARLPAGRRADPSGDRRGGDRPAPAA